MNSENNIVIGYDKNNNAIMSDDLEHIDIPNPSKEEILHKYGNVIAASTSAFVKMFQSRKAMSEKSAFIPEVIAKVGRQLAAAGQRLVGDLSDFVECAASVILEPRPAYAYALNRGAGEADNLPQKASLTKKGNGCELKIEIELANANATVVLGLLGEDGVPIERFNAEFTDAESGECLKRSATQGTLRFRNVTPGKYRIAASTEKQSCEFTLSIV